MAELAKSKNSYPRVLLVYNSRINKADQHGVSIRGWFGDWPKQNLAQIYSGGDVGEEVFCGYNFKIGQNERRFGKYFFKIKDSSIGQSSYPLQPDTKFKKLKKISLWTLLKNKISTFLINTGLWELIFRPILSKEMVKFVEDFNPQIIYCQGYSLTFSWLPVMLHNKFHIPICFQTGDDWPFYIYKDTAFSIVIKPIVHRAVKSLLSKSSARLANGKLMASEFNQKYGLSFEPLMMCDNLERFRKASPYRIASSDKISIIYTGGLAHGRWLSIIDLCDAAALLQNEGVNIMVTILATNIMPDVINKLSEINNLQILPGPSHEQLPSYLKGADILYLPESLNSIIAADIHLSISTKAHLYMMSEKPVLIYASNITGIANYAKENDWACIVEERNLDKLAQALRNIITNKEYREELVNKGIKVVSINHAEDKVRARFLTILTGLTNSN